MRKLLLACSLLVASIASLQAQVFADYVVDAGPCDPIIPIFCPGGVQNASHAVDADPGSYALLRTDLGLISTAFIDLGFTSNPSVGSIVGVNIEENNTILNVDLLESIVVDVLDTAGNVIVSKNDFNLTDLNVLIDNSEGRFISVKTPDTLDYVIQSVRVTVNGLLSVVNDLKVFSGVAIEPAGECGVTFLDKIINTDNVNDETNLTDEDPDNFAVISIPVSLGQNGFIHMELENVATAGDFVGFTIEPNNTFLELGVIGSLNIEGFDTAGNQVFEKSDLAIADLTLIANQTARAQIGYNIPAGDTIEVGSIKLTMSPIIGVLTELRVFNGLVLSNGAFGIDVTASSDKVCTGGNITLTAEAGFDTYTWNTGQTGQSISVETSGTYTVIAESNDGKCKVSGNIAIESEELNIAFTSEQPSCNNADGSVAVQVSGGSDTYSYMWSNNATDSNITSVPADVYFVTVTDATLGCEVTKQFNLSNPDGPFFTGFVVNATTGNNDGEIYLSVDERDSVTVDWTDGSNNFIRQGLAPGDYTAKVKDNSSCTSIITFTVLNGQNGVDNNGDSTFVLSATVNNATCNQANGSIDLEVGNTTNSYNYIWSNGATTQDIENLEAGLYSVIVTDANTGEQREATYAINSTGGPIINLDEIVEETCSGDRNASITINTAFIPGQIEWSNGATTATISDLAPGVYTVKVTDFVFGCSSYAEFTVIRRNPITYNISSTEVTCLPDTMDGTAMVTTTGGREDFTFEWSNGDDTALIENLSAGMYSVIFADANGCAFEDSVFVNLSSDCDGVVTPPGDDDVITERDDVPNVFTPNNDGTNDGWVVAKNPASYKELNVQVYNRLGDVVFENSNYDNSWTGTYKNTGEALPEGTYFYEIVAAKNGKRNIIKGFVVIKR
jgi:gliding motility-associated-like protein